MKVKYGQIISFMIPIIFMSLMLQYLYDLEKTECECAINDDRILLADLIKYYLFCILMSLILSLSNIVFFRFIKNVLGLVIVVLFIYLSVVFFRYNAKLTEIACECSQDDKKTAFKYYLYFYYFSLVLFILAYMYISARFELQHNSQKVSKKKL
tara:strand:- start:451 stop:912 length:462 start_codon:yes stop_codon:yes gene_type:complete